MIPPHVAPVTKNDGSIFAYRGIVSINSAILAYKFIPRSYLYITCKSFIIIIVKYGT